MAGLCLLFGFWSLTGWFTIQQLMSDGRRQRRLLSACCCLCGVEHIQLCHSLARQGSAPSGRLAVKSPDLSWPRLSGEGITTPERFPLS